jgi:hypothetical protein
MYRNYYTYTYIFIFIHIHSFIHSYSFIHSFSYPSHLEYRASFGVAVIIHNQTHGRTPLDE